MNAPACIAVIAAALAAGTGTARADDGLEHCTGFVTFLPYVISTDGGVWCMDTDLTLYNEGQSGVTIDARNAVLDCKGHTLRDESIRIGSGIRTGSTNHRVTIRNCRLEGFGTGISVRSDALNHTPAVAIIEDNVLVDSRNFGIRAVAIRHAQIRRNTVIGVGSRPFDGHPTGILVQVDGDAVVHGNVVTDVNGGGTDRGWIHGRGINVAAVGRSSVVGNIVSDVVPGTGGTAYGLLFPPGSRATVRGNQITGDGRASTRGIACADSSGVILVGNMVNGAGRPADKCPGDAGGRYFLPL